MFKNKKEEYQIDLPLHDSIHDFYNLGSLPSSNKRI